MDLKNFEVQPDSGLFEKIERRLRMRRLARVAGGVAAVGVAVAVVCVAWPGKSGAGEPGPMVAAMQPSQVQALSSSAQPDIEDLQSVGFEAVAASGTSPKREVVDAGVSVAEQPAATPTHTSTSPKLGEVDARSADGGVCVAEQPATSATHTSVSPDRAASSPTLGEQQVATMADGGTPSAQQGVEMPADKSKDPSATIVHEDNLMWAPNVIAPNGDVDENRTFKLKSTSAVTEFRLVIFNRGGRQVYQSNDPAFQWDGTYDGAAMPQGAYVWVAKFRDSDGRAHQEKGTVTIIR